MKKALKNYIIKIADKVDKKIKKNQLAYNKFLKNKEKNLQYKDLKD